MGPVGFIDLLRGPRRKVTAQAESGRPETSDDKNRLRAGWRGYGLVEF